MAGSVLYTGETQHTRWLKENVRNQLTLHSTLAGSPDWFPHVIKTTNQKAQHENCTQSVQNAQTNDFSCEGRYMQGCGERKYVVSVLCACASPVKNEQL